MTLLQRFRCEARRRGGWYGFHEAVDSMFPCFIMIAAFMLAAGFLVRFS